MLSIKNKDSNSIVSITKHELPKETEILLAPDNTLEILQVLKGDVEIQLLDKARPFDLQSGRYFVIKPRSRGMNVLAKQAASIRIIKIAPLNVRRFTKGLDEVATGVYSSSISPTVGSANSSSLDDLIKDDEDAPKNLNQKRTFSSSLDMIKKANGQIKVKDLYSTLNVSKSTLEHHFIQEIGLTPKEFCKIEKLNYFIETYKQNQLETLTELSYRCGYYDQSHLIKDFKHFLNTSPKKYFKSMIA
ncbi:MAG: AraC family transcriptional regulator [Cytophagales bacterium]|nr:AraC family transcriptional regulator [Cytophagales bacterium]